MDTANRGADSVAQARAAELARAAEAHQRSATTHLDYANKLVAARQADVEVAQLHVRTVEAGGGAAASTSASQQTDPKLVAAQDAENAARSRASDSAGQRSPPSARGRTRPVALAPAAPPMRRPAARDWVARRTSAQPLPRRARRRRRRGADRLTAKSMPAACGTAAGCTRIRRGLDVQAARVPRPDGLALPGRAGEGGVMPPRGRGRRISPARRAATGDPTERARAGFAIRGCPADLTHRRSGDRVEGTRIDTGGSVEIVASCCVVPTRGAGSPQSPQ